MNTYINKKYKNIIKEIILEELKNIYFPGEIIDLHVYGKNENVSNLNIEESLPLNVTNLPQYILNYIRQFPIIKYTYDEDILDKVKQFNYMILKKNNKYYILKYNGEYTPISSCRIIRQ